MAAQLRDVPRGIRQSKQQQQEPEGQPASGCSARHVTWARDGKAEAEMLTHARLHRLRSYLCCGVLWLLHFEGSWLSRKAADEVRQDSIRDPPPVALRLWTGVGMRRPGAPCMCVI